MALSRWRIDGKGTPPSKVQCSRCGKVISKVGLESHQLTKYCLAMLRERLRNEQRAEMEKRGWVPTVFQAADNERLDKGDPNRRIHQRLVTLPSDCALAPDELQQCYIAGDWVRQLVYAESEAVAEIPLEERVRAVVADLGKERA